MRESIEIPQHRRKLFLVLGAIVGAITVLLLIATIWLQNWIQKELAKPRHFGSISINPVGFRTQGWMEWGWAEIQIFYPDGVITLTRVGLEVHPARGRGFPAPIHLDCDSVKIEHKPIETRGAKVPKTKIEIPHLRIPIRVSAAFKHLSAEVQGKTWQMDSLTLRNSGQSKIIAQWKEVQGPLLPLPVEGRIQASCTRDFIELQASLRAEDDSLWIYAEAPLSHAEAFSTEIRAFSKKPSVWAPISAPTQIQLATQVQIQAKAQVHALRKTVAFDGEARLSLDSLWQLPRLKIRTQFSGNELLHLDAQVHANGGPDQSIYLSLNMQGKEVLDATGYVEGFPIQLGSFTLPSDVQLESVTLRHNELQVNATTGAGSQINAHIGNIKTMDPVKFKVLASASDPWIVGWCRGNLVIKPPSTIEGVYSQGRVEGHVRTAVDEAYKVTAEIFDTDVAVDASGVYLSNGLFITRGVEHRFQGEVVWDSIKRPHVQFEIIQDSTGTARLYHNLNGDMSINVSRLPTSKLPLKDISVLRNFQGIATGNWEHHFDSNQGNLQLAIETQFKDQPLDLRVQARQNGDSIIVESVQASTLGNQLIGSALLQLDSTKAPGIVLLRAQVHSESFAIPTLLQAFNDSTLRNGTLQGLMQYDHVRGIEGKLTIENLALHGMGEDQFSVSRFRMLGSGQNVQASARIHFGKNQFWNSEIELNVNKIFAKERGIALALVMDHGGVAWIEGLLDSTMTWRGDAHIEGPWILSQKGTELKTTRFDARLLFDTRKKLAGLSGVFHLDTLALANPLFNIPIKAHGFIRNSQVTLDSIRIYGENKTFIQGDMTLGLTPLQVVRMDFSSPKLDLLVDQVHQIKIQHLEGSARTSEGSLNVHLGIPSIRYQMATKDKGKAIAELEGSFDYTMPFGAGNDSNVRNPQITGKLQIHKLLYDRQVNMLDMNNLKSLAGKASKAVLAMQQEDKKKELGSQAQASQPTELDLRILDSGRDALFVNTSLATFPFTLDIRVLGSTDRPILDGDLNAVGKGFVGLEGFETLELQSLRIWWPGVEVFKGEMRLVADKEFPFCSQASDSKQEMCNVSVNVNGPITQPVPEPSADCGIEATPAQIYYSILIGCIAEDNGNNLDKNQIAGKLLSKLMTEGINQGLGGKYVGDIGLKYRFLDEATLDDRDSNYIRVPLKLDRWVKNLSLLMAYSQDRSQHPRYDQSYELGLAYSMPVLDSTDSVPNHINPTLDFSGKLVARRYPGTEAQVEEENRIEKSLGIFYSWKFWEWELGKSNKKKDSIP